MRKIFLFLSLVLLLSYYVMALGVVSDYLINDTLILVDGSHRLYEVRVQNQAEGEARVKITYDTDFIEVLNYKDEYKIPPKKDQAILFNVSAPPGLKVEQEYIVGYTVHQTGGGGPGVPVLIKIAKNFKVKIIKSKDKFYLSNYYSYVPQVIIILIVIVSIFKRDVIIKKIRKSRQKNRKIIKRKH